MTASAIAGALRVVPAVGWSGGRAGAMVERNVRVYRHAWLTLVSGFFEPLFYLLALGVGLGAMVGDVIGPDGQAVSYREFVAPAMLAASAMNGAIFDSTYNVFFKLKYAKIYDAVLSTPMTTRDVAVGEIGWALGRGLIYSAGFLAVMLALGLVSSWWALLVLPAALLIGFAFAGVGMAATTFMRSPGDFGWILLVAFPLFFLSATFFPLSTYPEAWQPVVRWSPLYQGVDLVRSFTTGAVHPGLWASALYLALMGVVGLGVSTRRLDLLLLT
ncbi:MAG: ABC transporter permease [Candidatus Nanopelagicales bacterium]